MSDDAGDAEANRNLKALHEMRKCAGPLFENIDNDDE